MAGLVPTGPRRRDDHHSAHEHTGVESPSEWTETGEQRQTIHCFDINHFQKQNKNTCPLAALANDISLEPHFSTDILQILRSREPKIFVNV